MRLQLLFELSENFEALISARYSQQDIDTGFFKYVSSQLQSMSVFGQFEIPFSDDMTLILGGAWNDIEVDVAPGVTSRSIQSPEVNLNGLVRYTIPLATGKLALQVNGVYLSEHIFALSNLPNVTEDGYSVFDASVSYSSGNGKWVLTAFITNITDEEYLVQTFDLSTTDVFGMTEQYYGRPRWWGISARYSWGD